MENLFCSEVAPRLWDLLRHPDDVESEDPPMSPEVQAQMIFLLRRISRKLPEDPVPGWARLHAVRAELFAPQRIKEDQWCIVAWTHHFLYSLRDWNPYAPSAWPAQLSTVWMIVTYMDEWVDEAPTSIERCARIEWIRDGPCRPIEEIRSQPIPDTWPEGLREDGPRLWALWKEEAHRTDPDRWERMRAIQCAMLSHERALSIHRPTDNPKILFENRIRTGEMSFQILRAIYGLDYVHPLVPAYFGAWMTLVDDLEDASEDAARDQWNWANALRPSRVTARALLRLCRTEFVRHLPDTAQMWSGMMHPLMRVFERRRPWPTLAESESKERER